MRRVTLITNTRGEVDHIQTTVAQFAAKAGFSVFVKNGHLTVKYRLPSRRSLKPTRPMYNTVAEIDVTLKRGRFLVMVEPCVFGNDRPKIDVLMTSLGKIQENIEIIKQC